MKKSIYFLFAILPMIVSLFVTSCSDKKPVAVTKMKVSEILSVDTVGLVMYVIKVTSNTTHMGEAHLNEAAFVDSVGKYNVGDPIEFSKVKPSQDTCDIDKYYDINHSEIK